MFRERIQAKYSDLTPSFRRLADFILQQQLNAAFMTATEMAHRMNVDAATVVRFAQNIGYSGFRELIKEVQQVVKAELTASYSPALEDQDDVGLFRSILENERHNLALAQTRMTEQANTLTFTHKFFEQLMKPVIRDCIQPEVSRTLRSLTSQSSSRGAPLPSSH